VRHVSQVTLWTWIILANSGDPACGQQETCPPSVTVSGEAELRIPPDEVILTLGVETYHQNLEESKKNNDQRVKKIIRGLFDAGIEARHVQTDYLHIMPNYESPPPPERRIRDYSCRKTIVVTLKDITRYEDILSRALEEGANHVHGVQFRTTELRTHRDQARALAVRAAREKAEALAKELQQTIGGAPVFATLVCKT